MHGALTGMSVHLMNGKGALFYKNKNTPPLTGERAARGKRKGHG